MRSKLLIRIAAISAIMVGVETGHASPFTWIAHWSFDSGAITSDANGILTAADETGAHNATRTNAASGARPINSVAGPFGQAAQFTNVIGEDAGGASRLQIPNLTELMGPSAGDFTVAAWVNTAAVGADNTILSDWITTNSYWFLLDNATASESRPRGQIRNQTNGDIIAATISGIEAGQANMADGQWHHYAWTWSKSTATMTWLIDGVQRATHTSGQTGTGLDVRISSNANAHIGWKQDSNDHFSGTLDELWVLNVVLPPGDVFHLMQTNVPPDAVPTTLTLQVDPTTGLTLLKNTTEASITFTSYRVASTTGALNTAGWNPISNGNELPAQFPPDNGIEDGLDWEVAPNPSSSELVEWFLTGESTLLVGQQLSLGNAVNPSGMPALQFTYSLPDETVRTGFVKYEAVTLVPPAGDYNNNGVVDAADYVVWRKNLNQSVSMPNDSTPGMVTQEDYEVWRANFGKTTAPGGAALGTGGAVPEPGTIGLLLLGAAAGMLRRQLG